MKLSTVILGLAVVLISACLYLFLSDEAESDVMDEGPAGAVDDTSPGKDLVRRKPVYETRTERTPAHEAGRSEDREPATVAPDAPSGSVILGRVRDKATSTSISGASVALLPSVVATDPNDVNVVTDLTMLRATNQPLATTTTDHQGGFRFDDVAPGDYTVLVRAKGYGRRFAEAFRILRELSRRHIEIALLPGVRFEGTVVSPDGSPVPGVRVELLDVAIGHAPLLRTYQEITNEKGRFVFEDLEPSIFSGTLTAEGYGVTGTGILVLRPGANPPHSFTLRPEAEVFGRVFDGSTNEGLANVVVYALVDIKERMFPAYLSTRSGEDGSYVLHGVPSTGDLVIGAIAERYTLDIGDGARTRLNPGIRLLDADRNGERELVDLKMFGGATLEGRVLAKGTLAPIEGAEVVVVSPQAIGLKGRSLPVQTDARGFYRVEHVPAGFFVVTATHPDYVAEYRGDPVAYLAGFLESTTNGDDDTKRLRPGEIREGVDVLMEPGVRLRGRVVGPGGEPVSGATVSFRAKSELWGSVKARLGLRMPVLSDEAGAFELGSVPSMKDIVVEAAHPDFKSKAEVALDLAQKPVPADLILELGRGASCEGRVLRGDGTLGTGLRVALRPEGVVAPSGSRRWMSGSQGEILSSRTDVEGRFRFKDIPAGSYSLDVAGGERMKVTLKAGETKKVTVHLPRTVLVRGVTVHEDGSIFPGVRVSIAAETITPSGMASVTTQSSAETDAAGHFEIWVEEGRFCTVRAFAMTKAATPTARIRITRWHLVGEPPTFVSGQQGDLRLVLEEKMQ
ncbi:MAG TPA: carboxypeptidase regulatory-like domain-containing protein [Planctomycetes bacterium]|nr:carboxypeptidase regulatory-like domain-containing protein [Planctomycetota bacterium]